MPQVTVEYDNLSVEADALVGSASIPSLTNVALGILKVSQALPAACCAAQHILYDPCFLVTASNWIGRPQDQQVACFEECVGCSQSGEPSLDLLLSEELYPDLITAACVFAPSSAGHDTTLAGLQPLTRHVMNQDAANLLQQGQQDVHCMRTATCYSTLLLPCLQGRTTLLVGPPGAGKSVLLQLLAGQFKNTAFCHITGDVRYNGKDKSEFVIQRTAGLVDQYDEHIANLTVHETLDFATACQVGKVKGQDHIIKVLALTSTCVRVCHRL